MSQEQTEPENPFAPPRAAIPAGAPSWVDRMEDPSLGWFVGPQRAYYLEKWRLKRLGRRFTAGFNGAAFLFTGMWLPYRKMYKITAILYAVLEVEALMEDVVFVKWLHRESVPEHINLAVTIATSVVCGAFGNAWYLAHARRKIQGIRVLGLEPAEEKRAIAKSGGVNFWSAILVLVLFVGLDMGIAYLIDYLQTLISG